MALLIVRWKPFTVLEPLTGTGNVTLTSRLHLQCPANLPVLLQLEAINDLVDLLEMIVFVGCDCVVYL